MTRSSVRCAHARRTICAVLFAAAALVASPPTGVAAAAGAPPDVATLLFATPQWTQAPAGSVITYGYTKKASNPSFGASLADHIVLTLTKGDDSTSRTIEVKMLSGVNAKRAGPFPADRQNPVLLLVLEQNVQELAQLFKADPRSLKDAIRKAWRDNVKIEPMQINVGGKTIPGKRIAVQPFIDDPALSRMKGLEGMVYMIDIADSVPGNIAAIDIHAPAGDAPKFRETLRFESSKVP